MCVLLVVRTGDRQSVSQARCGSGANMGKLQQFEITFDKNKVVYSPGESISGTVTVKLGQSLQCKGKSPLKVRVFRRRLRTWWEKVAVSKQGSNAWRFSQGCMECHSGL